MSTATDMLAKYMAAEVSLLEGKDTRFGDRSLGMEDLSSIIAGRKEWEMRVNAELAKANGVRSLGGLSTSVASFNSAPHSDRFNRNGGY